MVGTKLGGGASQQDLKAALGQMVALTDMLCEDLPRQTRAMKKLCQKGLAQYTLHDQATSGERASATARDCWATITKHRGLVADAVQGMLRLTGPDTLAQLGLGPPGVPPSQPTAGAASPPAADPPAGAPTPPAGEAGEPEPELKEPDGEYPFPGGGDTFSPA